MNILNAGFVRVHDGWRRFRAHARLPAVIPRMAAVLGRALVPLTTMATSIGLGGYMGYYWSGELEGRVRVVVRSQAAGCLAVMVGCAGITGFVSHSHIAAFREMAVDYASQIIVPAAIVNGASIGSELGMAENMNLIGVCTGIAAGAILGGQLVTIMMRCGQVARDVLEIAELRFNEANEKSLGIADAFGVLMIGGVWIRYQVKPILHGLQQIYSFSQLSHFNLRLG